MTPLAPEMPSAGIVGAMLKVLTLTIVTLASASVFAQTKPVQKKLIEFGWDEPSTRFMRAHLAEIEQTPFDGCVFTVLARDAKGADVQFMNECWGVRKFTLADLKGALDDLKATPFKKLTHNFLRFNVCPGNIDWFEDFSAVAHNAEVAARVAKAGGAKGILFDVEPYGAPLWDYSKAKNGKTRTFEQYQEQVRQRGRELMSGFQKGFPDVKVFLTFGFTLPEMQIEANPKGLAAVDYGLMPSLLNGMLDAAEGKSQIIDGYEPSYAYKEQAQFDESKKIRERSKRLVANADKYAKHYAFGYGIWMDLDWRKYGWDTKDFTKNFFTPQAFEKTVGMALKESDEYVWIYTEKPFWWSDKGPKELPKEYVDALERAKEEGQR
jgi:hypothetical protein